MLAVLRLATILPRLCQGFERAGFHIQAYRVSPMPGRRKTVADEVIFAFEQGPDHIVDQRGVDDRAIGSDADNIISIWPALPLDSSGQAHRRGCRA